MDVRIAQPLGYSELGGRSNNEDSIFPDPLHASTRQKWFLVCDGVGGADRGEVASRLAVTSLDSYFQHHPVSVATDEYLQQAVAYVEREFNAYFAENPQAIGMATTLTLLYIHEAGATVAHIGDSRVYHLRDGYIIWRTDDHSYVNELVKAGVISQMEAYRHPQRNVITRALQGGERSVTPSVQLLNDIRPGDYFFLCSDGVLERVSDELLEGTLGNPTESNDQKLAKLRQYSSGNTKDNFTAYLVQIESVSGDVPLGYQVATPVYERESANLEADDAITLINVPIPTNQQAEPVPAQINPTPPIPATLPNHQEAVPREPEPVGAYRSDAGREPVRPTPPPLAAKSSKRWLIPALTLAGAIAGAGGYYIWQEYLQPKPTPESSAKTITQDQPLASNPSQPAVTSTMSANDLENSPEVSPTDLGEKTEAGLSVKEVADEAGSTGLTVGSEVSNAAEPDKAAEASYKLVTEINHDVSVVRDTKSNLLGLRKSSGEWQTQRIYRDIGKFKNGVAEVKTEKGREKYINQQGERFISFSDYEKGIATLTDLEGNKRYLTKDGNWLDEVTEPSNSRIAVRKGKLWGYLNLNGQIAHRIQYDKASPFNDDGTAEVVLKGSTFRITRDFTRVDEKESGKSTNRQEALKKS